MDEKDLLELTVRKCISRLDKDFSEEQIQNLMERLFKLGNLKDIVDSLALRIDSYFGKNNQKGKYDSSMEDLLQLSNKIYNSKSEIIDEVERNKKTNYNPGDISVNENHRLIKSTLKEVCDRLNDLKVDYYVVGALSAFIATGTELFRYHGDIDFMVEEKDIEKVKEALEGTNYNFSDDRLNNKKRLEEGKGHTQGEHEVIANHKDNEFHLGFFLFRREKDKSITTREYFMQTDEDGNSIPMVLERNIPKELVELDYNEEEVDFAGTKFRTSSPENVFSKKSSTRHGKDLLDIEALEDKVDIDKINRAKRYKSTLNVVKALPEKNIDLLSSVIEVTKDIVTSSGIEEQFKFMKDIEREEKEK